ncbi:MAG: HU family DNA-binding protein [Pseudomonadota bacterium]
MTLIKEDLIKMISKKGFTKKRSTKLLESLLEIIKETLGNEEEILISGFGKFSPKRRHHRGRKLLTGELMPGVRKVVAFKCSPILRAKINSER